MGRRQAHGASVSPQRRRPEWRRRHQTASVEAMSIELMSMIKVHPKYNSTAATIRRARDEERQCRLLSPPGMRGGGRGHPPGADPLRESASGGGDLPALSVTARHSGGILGPSLPA